MNKDLLIKIAFGTSLVSVLTYLVLKIMHIQSPVLLLSTIAWISTLTYIILVLIEIISSDRIKTSEKVMWVAGFLFVNWIAGILYFISRRKYIIRNFKILPI
ncbi:PLDc N-terminal domain-containing protein [Pedobacter sp. JCM 36344]|uniref:PLDc N-terminal domain-containing protein n=1 Tax=Pedobacter sp. JCM 36344 TaxID=3374280 RepID=UPI00397BAD93